MQQRGTNNREIARTVLMAAVFAALIALFWGLDTLAKRNLRLVDGTGLDDFRLFTEQGTSALTVWFLVPAVAWWLKRFPVSREQLWSAVVGHIIGSALFAAAHFFVMIGMRIVIYRINEMQYYFSDLWLRNLLIEWQKDLKIYAAIIATLIAFRYFQKADADRSDESDRLAVQSGSGDHLLRYEDIEYFEASRNYISVHTNNREYLLRETVSRLETRLEKHRFIRTHRSFIVNQDHVSGIETTGTGHELVLASGRRVPLSRSRRDTVKRILGL